MSIARKLSLAAAAAICALSVATSAVAQPGFYNPGPIVNPTLSFDKQAFESSLRARLDNAGAGAGYAAIVIKDGQRVHDWADGWAIRPGYMNAYPNGVRWTVNTPANVGSTIKLASTVLLLRAFQSGYEGKTVEQWLDTPIVPYMPRAWRDFVNGRWEPQYVLMRSVTFRDLMQHRSGWSTTRPATAFGRIVQGVVPSQYGQRVYINWNYTLITYLLPRVVSPAYANWLDNTLASVNPSQASGNLEYGQRYGLFFENWMQSQLFNRVLPTQIHPSCDPFVDYAAQGRVFARSHGSSGGGYSEKVTNGGCHAQGGYYMSMLEMARLWATVQASENILSASTRALMYDQNEHRLPNAQDQLGWWLSSSPFLQQNFGMFGYPAHNGGHQDFRTAVVKLPHGYMAMVTTNQPTIGAGNLVSWTKDAFNAAVASNF